jgi:hypothetical protein
LSWHRFPEDLFQDSHGLPRAVAGSCGAIDLGSSVLVETHREFRTWPWLKAGDGRLRHHVAAVVSYVKLAGIFRSGSIVACGLDINVPLTSKAVEIVYERPAFSALSRR